MIQNGKNTGLQTQLSILYKRRKIVLLVFSVILGVMMLGSLVATPIYEGTVKIIIERVESNNLTGVAARQPIDPEFDLTQFQLMRSQAVARRVVSALHLDNDSNPYADFNQPSMFSRLTSQLKDWIAVYMEKIYSPEIAGEESPDSWTKADLIALDLTRELSISPVKGSDITEVRFNSPDPKFAADVANAFVQAYLEETLNMKMEATRRNLEWMTSKADTERLKLQAAENRLQEYMKAQDLVTLEDRVTILPDKLSQLGLSLVHAERKTKEYGLLYEKVKRASGNMNEAESVLSISEGTSLDVLRAQILKAEQIIMESSGKYGSKHPLMLKAMGDLDILKNKREQEIARITQKIRDQYELARSNENSIRAQLNETRAEALVLNEKYVKFSVIKREINANQQLYDALLTKIKDQSITGETRPINLWVVEAAKIPTSHVKPRLALNLMLGTVYGLICGIACAFIYNHLDNTIKSAEGVQDMLGVPVLGTVTYNKNSAAMNEIVRTDPRSEFSESYNALRTTLLLSSADAPPRKILVTSSIAGEGKTTTAINLALTLAKSGSRVVLIDMDMRKPRIHKVFSLSNSLGLSSYLAGGADKNILKKNALDNLVVVPAGPIPPNPYELLNSKRLKMLLQSLEQNFDVIICDSPPILSVADSRELSQNFDGLIIIAKAGITTFQMLQSSIQLLRGVNAKLLGVFINAARPIDQQYYQYHSRYIEDSTKPQVTT